ncbi:SHOCT domain-containing protein [Roseburia sp. CLA-AA-H204]|uniref:SHOCT domain-containing protein n=1 Tax=Roseburia amylophila TaxID=2981794 RepID=A0AAW4WH31_9FIRM|nr:SHOCT domain-containing protein [Roseburia amylophila]MCC2242611.1 SHOCT domain-containing protein [Roseburia amylophila]
MEEKILIEGLCNRVKGAFVENGHAVLTNKRFIYSKHSLTKIAAMGVLVNLTKGDFDFEIKIEDIKEVSEAKRLFDKILVVSTMSGDEYKFFFTKLEEWKIHFNNLLSNTDNNQQSADSVSVADELMKFKTLLDSGAITQSEYDLQKKKILGL